VTTSLSDGAKRDMKIVLRRIHFRFTWAIRCDRGLRPARRGCL